MIVPFASLCDRCRRRSPEWSTWPNCRECYQDICPQCGWAAGTRIEADLGQPETVICQDCYRGMDMQEYDISFMGRDTGASNILRYYIRTVIIAAGLHDAQRQVRERYQAVQNLRVLRHRQQGAQSWVYPHQEGQL